MRFLVRLRAVGADPSSLLPSVRTLAKSFGVEPRNPKWTSYGALELDFFCRSRADLDVFLAAAGPLAEPEFVTDLSRAPEHLSDERLLSKARALFNAERYWECHEVLEGLWRRKEGEEKSLLQGIILVCAAFVHHQKGEEEVALGVLARGANQLDPSRSEYGGFDLSKLRGNVRRVLSSRRFSNFRI